MKLKIFLLTITLSNIQIYCSLDIESLLNDIPVSIKKQFDNLAKDPNQEKEILLKSSYMLNSFVLKMAGFDENLPTTTPLAEAINIYNVKAVNALLKFGANANLQGRDYIAQLTDYLNDECLVIAQLLKKAGASFDKQDNLGQTPLMKAAKNGNSKLVKLLLEMGADIHKTDLYFMNALKYAYDYLSHTKIKDQFTFNVSDEIARARETVDIIEKFHKLYVKTISNKSALPDDVSDMVQEYL